MESLAIIAEFNPFHTGHARLIRQVRQAAAPEAAIVIIMSGAFVQRGEPAFFDKWHRAAWAIDGGADVVIELPAVYALSSAAGFAQGGVTLAAWAARPWPAASKAERRLTFSPWPAAPRD